MWAAILNICLPGLIIKTGSFALLNLFITIVLDEFNNLTDDDEVDTTITNAIPICWDGLKPECGLKTQDKVCF